VKTDWKVILAAALFMVGTAVPVVATAQDSVLSSTVGRNPKKLAVAEREAMQLLKLMDTDQYGKVSKQEFMNFMSAEFDRLDTYKSGELDVKELVNSRVRTRSPSTR
jgi:hypothetical protein